VAYKELKLKFKSSFDILQITLRMADVTMEEIESLQREFDWVLSTEVRSVVEQLRAAVQVEHC
jgi:hypothetical protein